MKYYIIPLSRFKSFETKDWNTAKQFASLFNLEVKQSSKPSESLIVISLDTPSEEKYNVDEMFIGSTHPVI